MNFSAPKVISAAVAVSVLFGCAASGPIKTYQGPQASAAEVAVLTVDRQTFVRDIAGYQTGIKFTDKNTPMDGTQFEVQPGVQKVVLDFYSYSSTSDNVGAPPKGTIVTTTRKATFTMAPIKISHDFEQGHKYELHYSRDGKKIAPQIVDVTNGGARRDYGPAWGQL